MREYQGFGGNALQLDSHKVIVRTQYIEETCPMGEIRGATFTAPNLTKNGCLTIVTSNNVVPIYFLPKHAGAMAEAFGIIDALARGNELSRTVLRGADGRKLGRAKCTLAGHPILRRPGRMNLYALPQALRCEYAFVDQGCTIPFTDIEAVAACTSQGETVACFDRTDAPRVSKVDSLAAARVVSVRFVCEGGCGALAFEGRTVPGIAAEVMRCLGLAVSDAACAELPVHTGAALASR